jgi:hypothetical protein
LFVNSNVVKYITQIRSEGRNVAYFSNLELV